MNESKVITSDNFWPGALGRSFLAALLTLCWTSLLLAEFGIFRAWPCWLLSAVIGLSVFLYLHPLSPCSLFDRKGTPSPPTGRSLLILLTASLLTLAVTLPPGESILGGWDPGVYLHTAAAIANKGSLHINEPDLAAISPSQRPLLGRYRDSHWHPFHGIRLQPDGTFAPQFFHAYPALTAAFWPFGGVSAALTVNPLLNVASLIALFALVSLLLDRRAAILATLLMALNPAQLWQAKFGTAELLAQCLLLTGAVFLIRALNPPPGNTTPRLDATLAGASLGMALLTRYDTLVLLTPLTILLIPTLFTPSTTSRRPVAIILSLLAIFGLHAWLHHHWITPQYHPAGNLVSAGLAAAVIMALGLTALLLSPLQPRLTLWLSNHQKLIRLLAAAVLLLVLFSYGYLRPRLTVNGNVLAACNAVFPDFHTTLLFAILTGPDAFNIACLQSLFGAPGLLLAFSGLAILILRLKSPGPLIWLSSATATLLLLMTLLFHERFMMFITRRTIPVITPLLVIGIAATTHELWRLAGNRRLIGFLVGAAVAACVILPTAPAIHAMARHREWPGLTRTLASLADSIPPSSIVYSDQRGFAAALRFLHQRHAFEVATGNTDANTALMQTAALEHPVYYLTLDSPGSHAPDGAERITTLPLDSATLGSSPIQVPLHMTPRRGTFILYRIHP